MREEFEKVFPVPEGADWWGVLEAYCTKNRASVHPYNHKWQAWQAATSLQAERVEELESALKAKNYLLDYVLQEEIHNRLEPRVIDIAYTAFMIAKQPNKEDGGASDWFNDTRPTIMKTISKLHDGFKALSATAREGGE
jgi:hypothetical protein